MRQHALNRPEVCSDELACFHLLKFENDYHVPTIAFLGSTFWLTDRQIFS